VVALLVINYVSITAGFFLLVLPFLFSGLGASSWALGSVLAACIYPLMALIKRKTIPVRYGELSLSISLIFVNLLFTCVHYRELPSVVQLLSLPIFALIYIASCVIAFWLSTQRLSELIKSVNTTTWLLLAAALTFQLVGLNLLNYNKSILYFSEPSHFAIAVAPFSVFLSLTATRCQVLFYSLLVLTFSLFCENATLLILFAICATVALLRLGIRLAPLFAILLIVLIAVVPLLLQHEYFAPRLSLSDDNLSSLVYLRGLESAQASLSEPPFIGVGFQMMGSRIHETNALTLLQNLKQESLNSQDGGFVAAKLVTEFGVIGTAALCFYLVIVLRGLPASIHQIRQGCISQSNCIYMASLASTLLQLFVRGSGYLGPFVCYALLTYWFRPSHSFLFANRVPQLPDNDNRHSVTPYP
jgi:hypothetical protein